MKYSVCIDALFQGSNLAESMKMIKEQGIDTFEFWVWWDKDLDSMLKVKDAMGMNISGFCTRFVSLADAAKREEFMQGLKESITAAKKMGAGFLITQVGDELPGVPRQVQHDSIVTGLKECVPILEEAGITLVFEPLNTLVDHKGYYLYSSVEAFAICDEVGSSRVKVLYDIYHQQIMEGNLISNITKNIDKIGHFHAAGNPGRHELNRGEINYAEILRAIDETGFQGYLGLEYFPVEYRVKGLHWLMTL
jgi:hydroxypyruvate isomerase